jgi:hypothetical protein
VRRWTILVGFFLAFSAACSPDSGDESAEASSPFSVAPTTTLVETADEPVPPPPDVGRLVVVDDEGRVVTVGPDGSDPVVLSQPSEVPFQPIWSPDGSRVAYATQSGRPQVVVADADGGDAQRAAVESPAFYLTWSPDGEQLGSLRNGSDAVALDVIDLASADLEAVELDQGAPYWLSWDPQGDRLAAHVGTDRLDVVGADGEISPLGVGPGAFRVPDWTDAGLLAVAADGGRQALVRIAVGGEVEPLAAIDGNVGFSANPAGTKVAIQSFEPDSAGEAVEASLPAQEPLPPNTLLVLDLETDEPTVVSLQDVLAFFWSPVGDRLLVLEVGEGERTVRWRVWNGETLSEGPSFQPGASFGTDFIAFFDQYQRSMSLWAPDGSGYAFPGSIDGEEGIWVADASSDRATMVAAGSWVAWSPT